MLLQKHAPAPRLLESPLGHGLRRLLVVAGLLLALTLAGMLGFRLLAPESSWIDCLYMAVITLTTVGYRETVPATDAVKIFIIVYLVLGVGLFTYSAFYLGQWVVSIEVRSLLGRRRMEKAIESLRGHYIVCGVGRMGETICRQLRRRGKPFVAVDLDRARLDVCEREGWPHVEGDATQDEVLEAAGIRRARSLATVLSTDADNVYVVLSAHLLNPTVQIIARASDDSAVEKMTRAGATRVVSPLSSGAVKIVRFMLNPTIEDFLEITDAQGMDVELADVQIPPSSPYVGKKLHETDLREKGIMILGIRRSSGERLMPPPGSAVIQAGDCLFAFGNAGAVNAMIAEEEGA